MRACKHVIPAGEPFFTDHSVGLVHHPVSALAAQKVRSSYLCLVCHHQYSRLSTLLTYEMHSFVQFVYHEIPNSPVVA